MSKHFKYFLSSRGTATSYLSSYRFQGNEQCKRADQTIWRTIKLLLRPEKLSEDHWEVILLEELHPKTLIHTWLLNHGTVLLRRFVHSKGEPICDPVDLLLANATCALDRP